MEKREALCTVHGTQIGAATVENSMDGPPKIIRSITHDPAIPLLGIYPKERKARSQRKICTHKLPAALLTIAKMSKQPKGPSVGVYILFCEKKEEYLVICNNRVELEGIIVSETGRTEKNKYCMISLLCGILKSQTDRNGE